MVIDKENQAAPAQSLLEWFRNKKRPLPWRKNRTPYSIWISEIMLHQTVVNAVVPYFEKWMKKYPDIATLARASETDVLRSWEGLGYYSRARNILKAARIVVTEFNGIIPDNEGDLRRLPGIGEYTAAAILSIAFGKAAPVVDANVRKVGRRLFGWKEWNPQTEKTLKRRLKNMIPAKAPGEFNEALMELGQTICLLENPLCGECPLQVWCVCFDKGLQETIPGKKARALIEKKSILLLLIHGGEILLRKKEEGLWKGMRVLPDFGTREEAEQFIVEMTGKQGQYIKELPQRIHHYTHYRDRLAPLVYCVERRSQRCKKDWGWILLKRLNRYPFPSMHRAILDDLIKNKKTQLRGLDS